MFRTGEGRKALLTLDLAVDKIYNIRQVMSKAISELTMMRSFRGTILQFHFRVRIDGIEGGSIGDHERLRQQRDKLFVGNAV